MNVRHVVLVGILLAPTLCSAQPLAEARVDAHGFPLPEGAFARIGNLHYAQPHEIQGVAISPDGNVGRYHRGLVAEHGAKGRKGPTVMRQRTAFSIQEQEP